MRLKRCGATLGLMRDSALAQCLNPEASANRVFWLTPKGRGLQKLCSTARRRPAPEHFAPDLDWSLYGEINSSTRSLVVLHLREPMQPARIKRLLYHRDSRIKLSAGNAARTMRFLRARGVVEPVFVGRRRLPQYQLTEVGRTFRDLLQRARAVPS